MSGDKKRIIIIGATSSIAEHCARLWIKEKPVNLVLVGRDQAKIEQVVADLQVRSPHSGVKGIQANFSDPTQIKELVNKIVMEGAVDIVLIAHGSLPDQQQCQEDLILCQEALIINGISPVLFAEAFAGHMLAADAGTLAIISSVAGERGRKSNYVYGAAKGLITRYTQGLQHRLAKTGVKVVLIKPGPTKTPMTMHLGSQYSRMASVDSVARQIVLAVKKGKPTVYVPIKWALIMMVIKNLPKFIFNKMDI